MTAGGVVSVVAVFRSRGGRVRGVLLVCCLIPLLVSTACGARVYRPGAAGQGDGGGASRVAVVPKALGFDFWERVRLGAECAAERYDGITLHWDGVTSESDVSGQQSLLQNLLAQGLDGLVYAATDARALAPVTRTALRQGVTVANIDSGTTPQPPEVPVFATDNVTAAERGTELLADRIGGSGTVALIEFQPGTNTNATRVRGFHRELRQRPGLELVARQSSDSSYNRALQVTQDILTAHPDLDGIYAANEPSTLGAAEAVRQAGRVGEIRIVGWDASEGQVRALRQGVLTGLIAQDPFRMGYESVRATVDELRGASPRFADTDTGARLVTRENVDSPSVRRLLEPDCASGTTP
ncbi:substrate-binding domain-containing protein [Actinopolyspora mortivallis]|uniref:substrate-binding domain-containing protein n=1 Tax=Actinopolyspora mortivallis TaxID=33906 RepID=UPI0015E607BF|nr:substrate-binding domain-containing protein [Actinopolyspora mortivallis]